MTEVDFEALLARIKALSPRRLGLIVALLNGYDDVVEAKISPASDFVNEEFADNFGDILRAHHQVSKEPFTKDKFEYALERVLNETGHTAEKAPTGLPGRDIDVDGERWSLKTQADSNIRADQIHISKFMELGKGLWESEEDLAGLRERMFEHLQRYDRIFTLRCLSQNKLRKSGPDHEYELVEIPKALLFRASDFDCRMEMGSKQTPKPGTCTVVDGEWGEWGEVLFQLYFDGGTERKLQVRKLAKDQCTVHTTWRFKKPV